MERTPGVGIKSSEIPCSLEQIVLKEPLIEKAKLFAGKVHENQKRDDGTPYFKHLEETARIAVEELGICDPDFVAACFLHDAVEDQDITLDEIRAEFGTGVSELVDGVTQIRREINEVPEKSVLKVLHRSFYSPEVGILKAACDRLHNMRTLEEARPDKKERKAKETLVYARLLESLGVWRKMIELEDLSFYFTDRQSYLEYQNKVESDPRTSEAEKGHFSSRIESALRRGGIKSDVSSKINGLMQLKNKMESKTPDFKDINDVITYTVVAPDDASCYQILYLLRLEFVNEEDVSRFDDYLLYPADNGYSALQMTIITSKGAVEIAITTKAKDDFNNWGVVSLLRQGQKDVSEYSLVLNFTPDGGVRFFKPGATGIDFAYAIDAGLAAKAVGLTVDGVKRDMSYILKNGEAVTVIPGEDRIAPDKYWLKPNMCQPKTRRVIEGQLLEEKRRETVEVGRKKIRGLVRARGLIELADLLEIEKYKSLLENFLTRIGCKGDVEKFYYQVGAGKSLTVVEKQLDEFGITKEIINLSSIYISGTDHTGIAEIVTSNIAALGVNIEHQHHKIVTKDGRKVFKWRIVTETLSERSKKKLEEALIESENIVFQEVVIV